MEWRVITLVIIVTLSPYCFADENDAFMLAQTSPEMKQLSYYLKTLRTSVDTALSKVNSQDPTHEALLRLVAITKVNIEEKSNIGDLMDHLRVLDAGLEDAWHELENKKSETSEGVRAVEIVLQFVPIANGLVTGLIRAIVADLNGIPNQLGSEEL